MGFKNLFGKKHRDNVMDMGQAKALRRLNKKVKKARKHEKIAEDIMAGRPTTIVGKAGHTTAEVAGNTTKKVVGFLSTMEAKFLAAYNAAKKEKNNSSK